MTFDLLQSMCSIKSAPSQSSSSCSIERPKLSTCAHSRAQNLFPVSSIYTSNPTQPVMNKLNIKEANEHLKQLHRRVIELENQVHMHALHSQELEKTNAELRARLEAAELSRQRELEAKDAQNAELVTRLGECEARVDILLRAAEERDRLVEDLDGKARLFYEVVEHRAALGRIVEVLDEIHKQKMASEKASPASPAKLNGERLVDESNRTSPADSNGTQSPPYTGNSLESPHVNSIT